MQELLRGSNRNLRAQNRSPRGKGQDTMSRGALSSRKFDDKIFAPSILFTTHDARYFEHSPIEFIARRRFEGQVLRLLHRSPSRTYPPEQIRARPPRERDKARRERTEREEG